MRQSLHVSRTPSTHTPKAKTAPRTIVDTLGFQDAKPVWVRLSDLFPPLPARAVPPPPLTPSWGLG